MTSHGALSANEIAMLDTLITFDQLPQTMPIPVLEAAIALVRQSLQPTDSASVKRAIAQLQGETFIPAGDGVDFKVRMTAFIVRLKPYPGDVITAACIEWADKNKFFPAWSELKPLLDKRMTFRMRAMDVFTRTLAHSRRELELSNG